MSARALVICDVDEVVLAFAAGLDRFLAERDLILDRSSFRLSGNIRRRATNAPVGADECSALLERFKRSESHALDAVRGAADALSGLTAFADIRFLTNIHPDDHGRRAEHLARLGMPYPVIANTGEKGPAAGRIAADHRARHDTAPAFFLDDSHANLNSVSRADAAIHLVHFIADAGFRSVAPEVPDALLRTGSWDEAGAAIRQIAIASMDGDGRT